MTWKIQAITNAHIGPDVCIDRDMLVGRHQDADILLQFAEISRRHAAFLLKDQALWLQDLNSSNGTFVNDVRIAEETLLHDGDQIKFAHVQFALIADVGSSDNNAAASVIAAPEANVEPPVLEAEVKHVEVLKQPSEAVASSKHHSISSQPNVNVKVLEVQPVVNQVEPVEIQPIEIQATEKQAEVAQLQSTPQPIDQAEEQAIYTATADEAVEVQSVVSAEPVVEQVQAQSQVQRSEAAKLSEQGIPSVTERAADVVLTHEGTPEFVAIPKPAPIPAGVDINAKVEHTTVVAAEVTNSHVEQTEAKKNTSVGLITIIVLLILAVLAWLMFK